MPSLLRFQFLLPFLLACFSTAHAQIPNYPSKPIRIVVPYTAGGSGDFLARLIGSKLSERLGQQVNIENKAGASGNIGTEYVARSPADGYTLLLATDIQFAINPRLYSKLGYDADNDFEPITLAAFIEFMLAVPTSLQVNTVAEFVTKAKERPERFSYASTGIGSTHHLSIEMFSSLAGIHLNHIPYKGSGQALPDLIGNNVQVMFFGVSQALPHVRSGKLKGLAVGSAKRLRATPDIPTLAESYPGFEANAWWGLYAPKGTPADIVSKLNAEVVRIVKSPDLVDELAKGGFEAFGSTPAELIARTKADRAKWEQVLLKANVKAD